MSFNVAKMHKSTSLLQHEKEVEKKECGMQ